METPVLTGNQQQLLTVMGKLRATYGAELVSAASLVNTARPTLSTAWLSLCCSKVLHDGNDVWIGQIWCCQANLMLPGKFGAVRKIWCCQANLMLPGKFGAAKQKFVLLVTVTTWTFLLLVRFIMLSLVLALESIKDAQAAEISALKIRIKRLEKKCKPSISHHKAWLKSVQRLSMKKRFGKKESVSKQGRKKSKLESTLDDSTVFDDQDADHGMEYMENEEAVDKGRQSGETKEVKLTNDTEVVKDKGSGDKGGNAKELVSTARPEVSTARPELSTARPDIDAAKQEDSVVEPRTPPKTTSIFDDED
ncbi:hypothetical protein Tco_1478236, partial [Tanacetum coccineum]